MNRSLVYRDDGSGWWQWTCGRAPCTRGGADRSQPAALTRACDHLAEHARFGFRTPERRPTVPADDLRRRFTFHAADANRADAHDKIRAAGFEFANVITDLVIDGAERRRAIDAVDDAVMRANAGLARQGR